MNQENYRKLVSGQRTGISAAFLRLVLGIGGWGYSAAVRLRNLLYSAGVLRVHRAGAPVISIGNITVGGTGKTPLAIWLCRFLAEKGHRCAILTRGYKAAQDSRPKTQDYWDEPAVLSESCPDAKVIVDPDRVAGAAEAVGKFGAEVLVMDDGFQHRRLARDIDIVAVDATSPFGYGKLLPAGLLREPAAGLRRAQAVVLTRSDQVSESRLAEIEQQLREINPDLTIAESIHAPVHARSAKAQIALEELRGKKVFAFCGIGNPESFPATIVGLGGEVVGSKIFDDHHHYTDDCLAEICEEAMRLGADLALTTQKDWTKLAGLPSTEKPANWAYLAVEIRFRTGQDALRGLIEQVLAGRISRT